MCKLFVAQVRILGVTFRVSYYPKAVKRRKTAKISFIITKKNRFFCIYLLVMPTYWGKQIFTHGRFPEVGQKQKMERKERASTHGARKPPGPTSYAWRTQAAWAKKIRFGSSDNPLGGQVKLYSHSFSLPLSFPFRPSVAIFPIHISLSLSYPWKPNTKSERPISTFPKPEPIHVTLTLSIQS